MADERAVAAFDAFFAATFDRIVGSLYLLTRDSAAAEDAAQEAYSRAFQRWSRLSGFDRPDLWVLRVGSNIAINRWKRTRRESSLDAVPEPWGPAAEIVDQTWLEWGLGKLSPRQRAAFILHHAEGWDVPSVARYMQTSPSTVETHLERARRRLRSLFATERRQ